MQTTKQFDLQLQNKERRVFTRIIVSDNGNYVNKPYKKTTKFENI